MSKKDKTSTVENPTTETPPAETTPVAPIEASPEATEIVKAPPAAIEVANDGRTMAHLIPRLPHLKRMLSRIQRPTLDEIEEAVTKLAPEKSRAFSEVLERLDPIKPGIHLSQSQTMRPRDIKIYQGLGEDDMRPQMVPVGGVYTKDGRILAVPRKFADLLKAPQTFKAVVVNIFGRQSFWPPRGKGKNGENEGKGRVPPGEHPFEKTPFSLMSGTPYCQSLDRERGDVFGDCHSCIYRPWPDRETPGDCKKDIELYVVLADFTGIYRIQLTGRSVGNAGKSLGEWMKNWPNPWHRVFEFEAIAKSGEETKNAWFEWQVRLAVSPEQPEGIPPTEEEKNLYKLLSAQITAELYLPNLANSYAKSFRASEELGSGKEKKASALNDVSDLNAAIASAEAAATKAPDAIDYSTNNL